ncbi:hypothetical protein BJ912DRAFT_1048451 [Pholiota molesta]|nr:hypothetical protein BJ912DRAFT_1048451 [Pholiota molesta]
MNSISGIRNVNYQLPLAANLISVGALTIQAWELVIHLNDEVQYLWRGRFNCVKALYFCSRYVMLAAQMCVVPFFPLCMAHQCYGYPPSLETIPRVNQLLSYGVAVRIANMGNCSGIFVFKAVIAHASLVMLEVILLIRVYALYNRSHKIKCFLTIVYVLALLLELVGITFVIRRLLQHQGCSPPKLEKISLLIFGLGAGHIQFILFALSLYKLIWDGRLSKTPLTSLLLREGVVVFLVVTAITAILITHELAHNLKLDFARATFSWYLSVISMAASNLILNMRKLAVKDTLRLQRPIESQNRAEEATTRTYDIDQSICLTSFYE